MNIKDVRKKIAKLLIEQKLGVLATLGKDHPYQSIVAFSASRDMKHILFATKRATSKYKNLKDKAQVSVFIDNRSNQESDFSDATGMTAIGDARELNGAARKKSMGLFIRKHPALAEFLASPDCALFMIKVRVYYVVWHFHQVREVRIS
ncbi:MAG: pyridoxamine 5'-phosphate oxidase family protein [Candidatus Omnitrophica bacterium]|nr:pyridoxamine 5'-phosphate oxidase family protein [Candidatus Omnitrophota bacterium]